MIAQRLTTLRTQTITLPGQTQSLLLSRRDSRFLQLVESRLARGKVLCDLLGIADIELRWADDAPDQIAFRDRPSRCVIPGTGQFEPALTLRNEGSQ